MAIRAGKYWETVPGQWPEDPPRERLTPAGAEYLVKNQVPPPRDDVRADSDGLHMTERLNDAGGKVRTFENVGDRKLWMDRFRAPLEEMVMLNVKERPKDDFNAIEARWRAERATREQAVRDIARGVDVRFDIETGERVS